jgi:hypothetical protein
VTARRAKRENGGLGEDPPGSKTQAINIRQPERSELGVSVVVRFCRVGVCRRGLLPHNNFYQREVGIFFIFLFFVFFQTRRKIAR